MGENPNKVFPPADAELVQQRRAPLVHEEPPVPPEEPAKGTGAVADPLFGIPPDLPPAATPPRSGRASAAAAPGKTADKKPGAAGRRK